MTHDEFVKELEDLMQDHFPEYECAVIVVDGPDPVLAKQTPSIVERLVDSLNECKYEVAYLPDQLNKDYFRPPFNMHLVNMHLVNKKLFKKVFTRRIDKRGRKPNRKVNLYN